MIFHRTRRAVAFARSWALAGSLLLAGREPGVADDGFWATAGGGSWANTGNWDSDTIADGADNTAHFGLTGFANVPASATFTLDGSRTIGHLFFTDDGGPDNWNLNTGSDGPLTLNATFDTPSIAVARADQQITINAVLAGADGLEKLLSGTLVLAAINTYSGDTTVSAGTLQVNGRIGSSAVLIAGGTLGGTGVISGLVTVQGGGTLAPGDSIGTLSLSNALTLQAGSTTRMEVNAATSAHDFVQGLSSVGYGGSLVVSNLAGTPALGQSFPIFSAANANGNFSGITPNPGAWLRWKFNPADGVLSVVSAASPPVIASATLAGDSLALTVTNGPPAATAYLLASTNVTLPRTNWSRVATNVFDVSGVLIFSNGFSAATPQRFYAISVSVAP